MASHDPEVSLAVRLQETPSNDEQDEGLDEFLSNLGFEFVNVNDGASVHDRNDELLSSSKSCSFYTGNPYLTTLCRYTRSPPSHRCTQHHNVALNGPVHVHLGS